MSVSIAAALVILVLGLITCFAGKQIYRIVLGLQMGVLVATIVLQRLAEAGQTGFLWEVVAGVVGLIAGFLAYRFLYKWSVAFFGAILAMSIVLALQGWLQMNPTVGTIVFVVAAVLGALIGNAMSDFVIRLSTAFTGAIYAVTGAILAAAAVNITLPLYNPLSGPHTGDTVQVLLTVAIVLVLGFMGFFTQSRRSASPA